MSQQDVWDAEDAEMRRVFAEKDAEIERLNVKLEKAGLIIAQCGLDWMKTKKLIGELADALEAEHDGYFFLIQRAREVIDETG